MELKQNLHAALPASLLSEAKRTAEADSVTLDELLREAVERYLEERRWRQIYRFGEQQTRTLGIKEEDVDRIIHEHRQEERQRQIKEQRR